MAQLPRLFSSASILSSQEFVWPGRDELLMQNRPEENGEKGSRMRDFDSRSCPQPHTD